MGTRKTKKRFVCILAVLLVIAAVGVTLGCRPDLRARGLILWDQATSRQTIQKKELPALRTVPLDEIRQGQTDISYRRSLCLVNEEFPVDDSVFPVLTEYKETGLLMDPAAAQAFAQLSAAVEERFGERLLITSSYRSKEEQIAEYQNDPTVAAKPGTSEHETGLALDVCVNRYAGAGFLKSPVGEFINRECWKYGFIIRYPMFKERVTGIGFEPWHIRYVGEPHAQIMYQNGWCLEEYLDTLTPGEFYSCAGYILSRQREDEPLKIPEGLRELSVSPDHQGYVVLTGKEE